MASNEVRFVHLPAQNDDDGVWINPVCVALVRPHRGDSALSVLVFADGSEVTVPLSARVTVAKLEEE